ncbi:NAD(P)-binding domain-containing protein [Aquiflexum gelatinilyticum]|uniref:NAD(P)-binding domain-containing protein n=1 Tax=Aquiflexum gelatinilyticum TaxID=2961943 RepID=A0A9X2T0N9_9BACT|nr:NAD(P)-binding domain-containing protein [Aquiflexum gelatinilyticum]MCR9015051.1 NAD(P)-binding domain-containing protein [Aquiflexum gelatinilyticum]
MSSISIIGLGWLGEPLAWHLLEKGHLVKGSTTSPDKLSGLQSKGIETALLKFNPHPEGIGFRSLFETDVLFVNIPPRSKSVPEGFYAEQIKFVKELAVQSKVKKIIFVSSTSVYPDWNQKVDESFPLTFENTGSQGILRAEQILQSEKSYDLTIIRFGGLLGVDRIPGRYFSGKSNVTGDSPVNYIHQVDAVRLSSWIIEKNLWNETFNGVAPMHPLRKDVYEKNSQELGFAPPISYAEDGEAMWKEISSDKILDTGFQFQMPDSLDFWYRP